MTLCMETLQTSLMPRKLETTYKLLKRTQEEKQAIKEIQSTVQSTIFQGRRPLRTLSTAHHTSSFHTPKLRDSLLIRCFTLQSSRFHTSNNFQVLLRLLIHSILQVAGSVCVCVHVYVCACARMYVHARVCI